MILFTTRFLYLYIWISFLQKTICQADMSGPAELTIHSIDQCPDPDQYKYIINIQRHKINRTHEAFNGDSNLGIPLDANTGIYVHIAKKSADGYKPNAYKLRDSNACLFLMRWVGKSFIDILNKIGQPPTCPLKAGTYSMKNFLIDHRELPATLPYGDFRADVYFIRDNENVICIQVFLSTKPKKLISR